MLNPQLLHNAAGYLGLREKSGTSSDPVILDLIRDLFPYWGDDSTLAWCSCFMNRIAVNVCAENTLHLEHPGMARGWLKVGQPIAREELQPGDVVIFWRGSPRGSKGHVGIFCRDHGDRITVLGGNQGNAVTVSDYAAIRFLGARRLRPD